MNYLVISASTTNEDVHAWALETGSHIALFKQNVSMPRALASINSASRSRNALLSHYLVTCQRSRPAIHLYQWTKEQPIYRCATAEVMLCVAVSPGGTYCVTGGISGRIYVWQTSNGQLLRQWSPHYKAVSALAFTEDGSFLCSGGEDAMIHVWNFVDIVDRDSRASDDEPSAFCTWSNHSLSVTKIVTGTGKAHAKVVSSSLDRTCRVWHIPSKSQLLVVTCPAHLNSCAMDAAETRLFMAGGDGVVYEAAISASGLATLQLDRGQTTARSAIDLIGAHRSKATDDEAQNSLQQYVGHTQSVADIAVTSNGSLLVSGSDDGTVRVWDTVSHQQVRRFEHHQGGVGALLLIPYPEALSTSSTPMRFAPIAPLRKYGTAVGAEEEIDDPIDIVGDRANDLMPSSASSVARRQQRLQLLLAGRQQAAAAVASLPDEAQEEEAEHAAPSDEPSAALSSEEQAESVDALKAELARLQDENKRWQDVNSQLMKQLQSSASGKTKRKR